FAGHDNYSVREGTSRTRVAVHPETVPGTRAKTPRSPCRTLATGNRPSRFLYQRTASGLWDRHRLSRRKTGGVARRAALCPARRDSLLSRSALLPYRTTRGSRLKSESPPADTPLPRASLRGA